jgi:DNA polymerase (family 10)
MLDTGKLEFYERLKAEVPVGVVEMMRVNGVGPKKAKLFWKELDITGLAALEQAAREGKLRDLPGMGEKSERKILDGIAALGRKTGRTPLAVALPAAQAILDKLLTLPEAIEGAIAGSIRRGRPTIGDVDILIASDNAAPVMDTFVKMENVSRVLGHGDQEHRRTAQQASGGRARAGKSALGDGAELLHPAARRTISVCANWR